MPKIDMAPLLQLDLSLYVKAPEWIPHFHSKSSHCHEECISTSGTVATIPFRFLFHLRRNDKKQISRDNTFLLFSYEKSVYLAVFSQQFVCFRLSIIVMFYEYDK